ncbi:MAG: hypothetical protein GWO20_19390 [Candidatus Korarchaeota archaeon]|nr:hypothetical protein [Candidatus Korarchaeota archaeon]NIU85418.1 hypothetical protein [Candidatus Thorarchaeota archaeon]NIW15515.1 hypothetical protein [Candidatus Thorarchaeota archaeon]NIW53460.1 hypothetical protein [Candidatus Korarchaeota archaeon]
MNGGQTVQTLKHVLSIAAIGTLLLANLLILPIQAGTLETSPQRGSLTYKGRTRGRHSTTFFSWKDTAVSSYPLSTEEFSTMSTSSNDDSNNMEVGIEWINLYPPDDDTWGDLEYCDDDAEGFYDLLGANGWTQSDVNYGNDDAWEKDFEKASVGGWDSTYIDNVDFAYFAGHGDIGFLKFSTDHDGDGSHETEVHYSETKWGDGDLEWIALSSCRTLHPSVKEEWIAHACAGGHLHAIVGFKTNMPDTADLGETFAWHLLDGKGIKDAWKTATKEEFGSAVEAAIIYAVVYSTVGSPINYAQETLPNEGNYLSDPSYYAQYYMFSSPVYYYDSWSC